MQKDPEKLVGNFNEHSFPRPITALERGIFRVALQGEMAANEPQEIIRTGVSLAHNKLDEILGPHNKLTRSNFVLPAVNFMRSSAKHPDWAGYFDPRTNEIAIITDQITGHPDGKTKVFIHEYVHFLSHNGRDEHERVNANSPLSRNNNIGFHRYRGLDIRQGREGQLTSDYFLAFNEAVTEQFARDVMPGVYETYGDYVGLLNQVIDDTVTRGLGSRGENGVIEPWTRDQVKNYIYRCFFKGNLDGFTGLLKNVYKEYDISEQEFGLMTHKDDLPSSIHRQMRDDPRSPSPTPASVAVRLRQRINRKTDADYLTDVINPDEPKPETVDKAAELRYGKEYDDYIKKYGIRHARTETIEGEPYEFDNHGYMIYSGEAATRALGNIKTELDKLLKQNIDASTIRDRMDALLFDQYRMSMLSEGFRDFYIYKHSKID